MRICLLSKQPQISLIALRGIHPRSFRNDLAYLESAIEGYSMTLYVSIENDFIHLQPDPYACVGLRQSRRRLTIAASCAQSRISSASLDPPDVQMLSTGCCDTANWNRLGSVTARSAWIGYRYEKFRRAEQLQGFAPFASILLHTVELLTSS